MKISEMKEYYFSEKTELALASESDIQRLATWLEANEYDAEGAWVVWESAKEELHFMTAELNAFL